MLYVTYVIFAVFFAKLSLVSCFFEIIFYSFLWKLLMLYVIYIIFAFCANCPLLTFFVFVEVFFICVEGPILGEFHFSMNDGTLLDKFLSILFGFCWKNEDNQDLCCSKKFYFAKLHKKSYNPKNNYFFGLQFLDLFYLSILNI